MFLQCVAVCCSVLQCVAVCCSAIARHLFGHDMFCFESAAVRIVKEENTMHICHRLHAIFVKTARIRQAIGSRAILKYLILHTRIFLFLTNNYWMIK